MVRGGSDSVVCDPPEGPTGVVPPAALGGGLHAPMPPLGAHGHLFSSMPTFFFVRYGPYFLSHGIRQAWIMPQSGGVHVSSGVFQAFPRASENGCRSRPTLPVTAISWSASWKGMCLQVRSVAHAYSTTSLI